MKRKAVNAVTFVDLEGKERIAIVKGAFEGEFLDLQYLDKGEPTIAYEVPRCTDRTKKFCWK